MTLKKKILIAITAAVVLPGTVLYLLRCFAPETVRGEGLLFITIAILAVTALLIAAWLYSGLIKPLLKLRKATREIREGNLDYELKIEGNDEISELCRDFETMRLKLKENAEEKMRIDSENRLFISNISHDLKTPITAIKGYADGIMDGVANTPEKLDRYVRTIYSKANDMNALIDELTLYSRIDMNKVPYVFRKIEISKFFSAYAEDIKTDLESQNIDLSYYDSLPEGTLILGDEEQLRRVVNNIISNSVKYMGERKGLISIRLKDEPEFVHIEIEDNGKGIEKEALPHIFDRFYRADSSRNSQTGGSGIGLSIVKKIVEDHGGSVRVVSEIGVGTVMHIRLKKYTEDENE